jgi:hypothetical protein
MVPLVVWALGGLFRGWSERQRQKEAEWRRLHELSIILYNKAGSSGLWSQLVAVRELRRLKSRAAEAKDIASLAALHFRSGTQSEGTAILVEELEAFAASGWHRQPAWLVSKRRRFEEAVHQGE